MPACMTCPVDSKAVLRDVLAELGRARMLAVSIAALSAFLVAAVLPIPAAYELWRVGQVAEWREVSVRLDGVEKSSLQLR